MLLSIKQIKSQRKARQSRSDVIYDLRPQSIPKLVAPLNLHKVDTLSKSTTDSRSRSEQINIQPNDNNHSANCNRIITNSSIAGPLPPIHEDMEDREVKFQLEIDIVNEVHVDPEYEDNNDPPPFGSKIG